MAEGESFSIASSKPPLKGRPKDSLLESDVGLLGIVTGFLIFLVLDRAAGPPHLDFNPSCCQREPSGILIDTGGSIRQSDQLRIGLKPPEYLLSGARWVKTWLEASAFQHPHTYMAAFGSTYGRYTMLSSTPIT